MRSSPSQLIELLLGPLMTAVLFEQDDIDSVAIAVNTEVSIIHLTLPLTGCLLCLQWIMATGSECPVALIPLYAYDLSFGLIALVLLDS